MVVTIEGSLGAIPISLKLEFSPDETVSRVVRGMTKLISEPVQALAPETMPAAVAVEKPRRKRRTFQRRISKADDGRVEVSAPEMTMLRILPNDGSQMSLSRIAEQVWPGRTARDGGPLVGPAARVAGGLFEKGLATIEGSGGSKLVAAVTDWKKKAVEIQK